MPLIGAGPGAGPGATSPVGDALIGCAAGDSPALHGPRIPGVTVDTLGGSGHCTGFTGFTGFTAERLGS